VRLCLPPLAMLLLVVTGLPAAAQPVCRTILNDGRVVLSEPFRDMNGLTCTAPFALHQEHAEARRNILPSTSFTTGPIGPFTTGSLPAVTTGSLPPLTTFSNSQPAARR